MEKVSLPEAWSPSGEGRTPAQGYPNIAKNHDSFKAFLILAGGCEFRDKKFQNGFFLFWALPG
jgi:hypothetical protein